MNKAEIHNKIPKTAIIERINFRFSKSILGKSEKNQVYAT